jgi:hypothetical protein
MSKKITLLFLIIVLLGINLGIYYKVFYKKPVIKESSTNIIKDEAPPFLVASLNKSLTCVRQGEFGFLLTYIMSG